MHDDHIHKQKGQANFLDDMNCLATKKKIDHFMALKLTVQLVLSEDATIFLMHYEVFLFRKANLKIMQDKEKLLLKKSQLLSSSCNDFLMISFSTSEYLASFYGTENVAIFFGQTFTLICEVEKFYSAGSFSLSSFHICPSS